MKTAVHVFDEVFAAAFPGPSWDAWRAFLAALFGLPMSDASAATFRACTGRAELPRGPSCEAWLVCGRRAGKSRVAAFLACFLACFRTYALAPGERGVVMVLASDRTQAKVIFRYVVALLEAVPMLARLIVEKRAESIELANGIDIAIHTASFKAVRGYTVVGALIDEIAFFSVDDAAANPDTEILSALRPAMATIPGALLIGLSSPYARKGELWRAYQEHYGRDGDRVLVWQAASRVMNPALPQSVVDAAYAADEAAARAEYGAEFRTDVESYISPEIVTAATIADRIEMPYTARLEYSGFTDPSGGAGGDSYTLAISHLEGARVVLDLVRETRPPFSPEAITASYAALCRAYRVREVRGDRYAGEWPSEQWSKHGIRYRPAEMTKSELYLELLPLLTAGRVELLDLPVLRKQLLGLERRTSRAGRDAVDHAARKAAHDDVVNAAAGSLVWAADPRRTRPALLVVRATDAQTMPASSAMATIRAAKSERLRKEMQALGLR